jgi:hypothetical protein
MSPEGSAPNKDHPMLSCSLVTFFASEPRLSRFDVKLRRAGILYVHQLVEIPSVELFKRFRTSAKNQERFHRLAKDFQLKIP